MDPAGNKLNIVEVSFYSWIKTNLSIAWRWRTICGCLLSLFKIWEVLILFVLKYRCSILTVWRNVCKMFDQVCVRMRCFLSWSILKFNFEMYFDWEIHMIWILVQSMALALFKFCIIVERVHVVYWYNHIMPETTNSI